jgi:CRP/FNR family transcriptional regulator|tara:strand:+ start:11204 stop:11956 length:753 start_codon:yes stop_codon:yes gene_type:complete
MPTSIKLKDTMTACPHNSHVSCGNCRLNTLCLPIALRTDDISRLDEIIQRGKPINKNEYLYKQNSPFSSVYAVRSGCLKAYRLTNDGEEQITGFYFPGEILGMDGIGKNKHNCSAKALETSAVCEIPFEQLGELSTQLPELQKHFFQIMSHEISSDQQLITLLSKNSAEEKLATLLISLSARFAQRKLSSTKFRLPMSRTDIGNYLGLTVETVSRVFGRFQKQNLLSVDGKEVKILDFDELKSISAISEI